MPGRFNPDDCDYRRIWQSLFTGTGVARGGPLVSIAPTFLELLRTLGLTDTGENRRRSRQSLQRLGSVEFVGTYEDLSVRFRLIHAYQVGASTVQVFLPTMFALAAEYRRDVAWIDLTEQRKLTSEAARRLHVWLSWWCGGKERQRIRLHKLVPHVWGDEGATETAVRYRRKCLSNALDQIAMLPGWRVEEDPFGMVTVAMPRRRVTKRKPARTPAGDQLQNNGGSA